MDKNNQTNNANIEDFANHMGRLIHITNGITLLADCIERQYQKEDSGVYSMTKILLEYSENTQGQYYQLGKTFNLPI